VRKGGGRDDFKSTPLKGGRQTIINISKEERIQARPEKLEGNPLPSSELKNTTQTLSKGTNEGGENLFTRKRKPKEIWKTPSRVYD